MMVKMRLALKCKLYIACQLRVENPLSMFHAKQMIPIQKDNPDIPKCCIFNFEMRRGSLLQSVTDDCKEYRDQSRALNQQARQSHRHKKWHFMCTKEPSTGRNQ